MRICLCKCLEPLYELLDHPVQGGDEDQQVYEKSLGPEAVFHVPTKRTIRPSHREFPITEARVTISDDSRDGVRAVLTPTSTPMYGWSANRERGAPGALRELSQKLLKWRQELERLAEEEERFGC